MKTMSSPLAKGFLADFQKLLAEEHLPHVVKCLEQSTVGVMNAVGPKGGLPIGKLLEACKEAAKSDATFTFVPDDFLEAQQIGEWVDMPAWVSPRKPGGGVAAVSIERALKAGIAFRSPVETARDTLEWYRATKRKANFPFTKDKESKALVAWHEKQKAGGGVKKS